MLKQCKVFIEGYLFDLTPAIRKAIEFNKKRLTIVLEGPPGFIQFLPRLGDALTDCLKESGTDADIVLRLEPAYGACDVWDYGYADIVVHIGHEPYPYTSGSYGGKTIFIAGEYVHADANDVIEKLAKYRFESIAVLFSAQHRSLAIKLCNILREKRIKCYIPSRALHGCFTFPHIEVSRVTDLVLVIAGGVFHLVSFSLSSLQFDESILDKTLHYDPYTERLEAAKPIVNRVLNIRYSVIMRALGSERYGIIVGVKPGQQRLWITNYLVKLLKRKGKKYSILISSRLIPSDLDNLHPDEFDAYIITSCPYIPLDDLASYHKPVLTPGEARMVLTGQLYPYRYPW